MGVALIVRKKVPHIFQFILALVIVTAVALTYHLKHDPKFVGLIIIGGFLLFILLWLVELGGGTVLTIDDEGIYDRRLGIGTIRWSDIEGAQLFNEYGQRYICLKVKNTDSYLKQMEESKRQKIVDSRQLGFLHFNVSVRHLNISLLDLHKAIEERSSTP
jgi:hypothetical protein